ncbi:hypothetical protein LINPERHAP2_LOCUS18044 [Linum perenne]
MSFRSSTGSPIPPFEILQHQSQDLRLVRNGRRLRSKLEFRRVDLDSLLSVCQLVSTMYCVSGSEYEEIHDCPPQKAVSL